jgi:ATP-dependent Lhr-like helicase
MLDELTSSGEVVWAGAGSLPGGDGFVALAPAHTAALLLPETVELELDDVHRAVLDTLASGGGWFFRALSDRVGPAVAPGAGGVDDTRLGEALWDLVWSGQVTGDTWAPLRAHLAGPRRKPRTAAAPARSGPRGRYVRPRSAMPSRTGPPSVSGRWSLLEPRSTDVTLRAAAVAEGLLDRHGVVTRGAVMAERIVGGFAGVYRVLSAYEDAGRCRRAYVVEGLGAAQFALPGAIDRVRAVAPDRRDPGALPAAVVLAATDPANPYGAALGWPVQADDVASGHRPGRKAGALVVIVDGALVLYVERGGRTFLTWSDDADVLRSATSALAAAVRGGVLGRLTVQKADGESVLSPRSPLGAALESAGFTATPQGLRLRG